MTIWSNHERPGRIVRMKKVKSKIIVCTDKVPIREENFMQKEDDQLIVAEDKPVRITIIMM